MKKERLLKSEKIRLKNDKLREQGKDPLRGWGKMVDTGLGGINKSSGSISGDIDNTGFIKDLQKEIARENDYKRQ